MQKKKESATSKSAKHPPSWGSYIFAATRTLCTESAIPLAYARTRWKTWLQFVNGILFFLLPWVNTAHTGQLFHYITLGDMRCATHLHHSTYASKGGVEVAIKMRSFVECAHSLRSNRNEKDCPVYIAKVVRWRSLTVCKPKGRDHKTVTWRMIIAGKSIRCMTHCERWHNTTSVFFFNCQRIYRHCVCNSLNHDTLWTYIYQIQIIFNIYAQLLCSFSFSHMFHAPWCSLPPFVSGCKTPRQKASVL